MTRYERRMYFETLCALKEQAATASELDRIPVISIEAVIAWAEAEMARPVVLDQIAAEEPKA